MSNTNPTKIQGLIKCCGRVRSSCSTSGTLRVTLVTIPVFMNEERTGLWWLWQTEHMLGHISHIYSVTVNQVMVATVKLSKRCLQRNPGFRSFHFSNNPLSKKLSCFQSFNFEHVWWRLFKKRVVCTNFDIYIFSTFDFFQGLIVDFSIES